MRIECVMLCGAITETEKNRLDLTWVDQSAYQLFESQLPYEMTLNLFGRFIVESGDDLGSHEMDIVIQSPSHDYIGEMIPIKVSLDPAIGGGNPFIDASFERAFSVEEPGAHWVKLSLDEHSLYSVPFMVYVLPDLV